jgi:hypothetical protein
MAAHTGLASLRPRCVRGGSPVAAMPIYHLPSAYARSTERPENGNYCKPNAMYIVLMSMVFNACQTLIRS